MVGGGGLPMPWRTTGSPPRSTHRPRAGTPSRCPRSSTRRTGKVRTVKRKGEFYWRCEPIFVSKALAGQRLGLRRTGEDTWTVHFGRLELGCLDTRAPRLVPHPTLIGHRDDGTAA